MSIRAEFLSTYAKKNSGYNRRQMKFLISHSAITRHIKIKAAVGAFMHERLRQMCSSLQACFFDLTHSIKTMKKDLQKQSATKQIMMQLTQKLQKLLYVQHLKLQV